MSVRKLIKNQIITNDSSLVSGSIVVINTYEQLQLLFYLLPIVLHHFDFFLSSYIPII